MPSHSRDAYLLAFHYIYCQRRSPIEVSKELGIHPQVVERAATGYASANEGRAGRQAFLEWCRGLRSDGGVPCCGGQLIEGDRPVLTVASLVAQKIQKLQEEINQLKREASRGVVADDPAHAA